MTPLEITLFFSWVLFCVPEDIRGFEKYRDRMTGKAYARHLKYYTKNKPECIARSAIFKKTELAISKQRTRNRERTQFDTLFKLRRALSSRIRDAIKKGIFSLGTQSLLGCNLSALKTHLEKQWLPGMTWENWGFGNNCWHIDHRRPCASFNLHNLDEQKQCFHFSNLQPLWQRDNLSKGAKWQ